MTLPRMRELFATLVVIQTSFLYGTNSGFSAYLLPQLRENECSSMIKDEQFLSLIVVSGMCLIPLGNLLNAYTIEKFGRRGSIRIMIAISSIFWLLIAIVRNTFTLMFYRSIIGLAVGMTSSSEIYILEVCSQKYRGNFSACSSLSVRLGSVIMYLLMYFLHWRMAALAISGYSVFVFILTLYIPESKYWYIMENRINEAKESITWFTTATDETIYCEIKDIRNSIPEAVSFSDRLRALCPKFVLKSVLIVAGLQIFQQSTGNPIIASYMVDYYRLLNTPYSNEILALISGFVALFFAIILTLIIHWYPRRTILISAAFGITISVGSLLLYRICGIDMPIVPVICVLTYIAFYNSGISQISRIILPELLPTHIRGSISSIVSIFYFFTQLIVISLYPIILNYFGFEWLITIFLIGCIGTNIISIFFIPETGTVSLHSIAPA